MVKRWLVVVVATVSVALGVSSCTLDQSSGPDLTTAPTEAALREAIPLGPMYAAVRANPNSLGNRHNAGLDAILTRGKELRRAMGGRKLTTKQACELLADVSIEHMSLDDLPSATLSARQPKKKCDPRQFAEKASRRFEKERVVRGTPAGGMLASTETMDWIDSLWLDDAEWEGPDDFPTFDDDLAVLTQYETSIMQAISSSSDLASLQTALSTIISSTVVYDSVHAGLLVENVALAASSADYWNESLPEWLETFCTERDPGGGGGGDMQASVANTTEPEICETDNSMRELASMEDGVNWIKVGLVVGKDAEAPFSWIKDGINAYKAAEESWYQAARSKPGMKVMIRHLAPVGKQAAKLAAKTLLRGNFVGMAGSTIYESGYAAFAVYGTD